MEGNTVSRFEKFGRVEDIDDTDGEGVPPEFADFIEETAEPVDQSTAETQAAHARGEEAIAAFLLHEPSTDI